MNRKFVSRQAVLVVSLLGLAGCQSGPGATSGSGGYPAWKNNSAAARQAVPASPQTAGGTGSNDRFVPTSGAGSGSVVGASGGAPVSGSNPALPQVPSTNSNFGQAPLSNPYSNGVTPPNPYASGVTPSSTYSSAMPPGTSTGLPSNGPSPATVSPPPPLNTPGAVSAPGLSEVPLPPLGSIPGSSNVPPPGPPPGNLGGGHN